MKPIPREFYLRDTSRVAQDLLGKRMIRRIGDITMSGIITETEAYKYKDDSASHAFNGMTQRNKAMFGEVGKAYVYFTYGMYYCVNAVAKTEKVDAGAVLIRSIKPEHGISIMLHNRSNKSMRNLTNGPAKITQAMQIGSELYGIDLTRKTELFITEGIKDVGKIKSSPRIGISKAIDKKWNFKIET